MILDLQITSEPCQRFEITLGELDYSVEIKFNDRSGVWTIDLNEVVTSKILFAGVPLLLGEDLLSPYNYNIGKLMLLNNSAEFKDATSENLGSSLSLYYLTDDELVDG